MNFTVACWMFKALISASLRSVTSDPFLWTTDITKASGLVEIIPLLLKHDWRNPKIGYSTETIWVQVMTILFIDGEQLCDSVKVEQSRSSNELNLKFHILSRVPCVFTNNRSELKHSSFVRIFQAHFVFCFILNYYEYLYRSDKSHDMSSLIYCLSLSPYHIIIFNLISLSLD